MQDILTLTWTQLEELIGSIGVRQAESGGMLGGRNGKVSHYIFDEHSRVARATYTPDHHFLNRILKKEWNPQGIRLLGFVHSHPGMNDCPSIGDEEYASRILDAIDDLDSLWLPIINTIPDTGCFRLTPWQARRQRKGVQVERGMVRVIDAPAHSPLVVAGQPVLEAVRRDEPMQEIMIGKPQRRSHVMKVADQRAAFSPDRTFERVRDAYDLEVMHNSRLIAVGAGGAAEWLEQLARAGLGQFVLIDPDVVEEPNLATQQTYRKDIGRPKVECIAERILDINPGATVIALPKSLDELSDAEIRKLCLAEAGAAHPVHKVVLAGLTDDFHAQARVNRLALHLGLPSLCAQVYREGRAAEVTFTYPGITPACHRCILSKRYEAYENGYKNDVTSHGTPIFSTARLNAIKGFILLAMLHHGSAHPRWGGLLKRIGNRNLIQVRMDPDLASTLGIGIFDKVQDPAFRDRFLFDETVWLPQQHEAPETGYEQPCPDCGGSGDLRTAIGKFEDTGTVWSTRERVELA